MPTFSLASEIFAYGDYTEDEKTRFMLFEAILSKNLEEIEKIIKNIKDIDLILSDGSSLLSSSVSLRSLPIMQALLKAKANPNQEDDEGTTPLQLAAQKNFADEIKALIEGKANPDIQFQEDGFTALHMAAQGNNVDAVKALIEGKANPHIQLDEKHGFTALHVAVNKNNFDAVKALINRKADLNSKFDHLGSALVIASSEGYLEIAKVLIENKADINCISQNASPLRWASQNNHIEIAEYLLKEGADPNLSDTIYDSSPLHAASELGNLEIVKLLVMRDDIQLNSQVKYKLNTKFRVKVDGELKSPSLTPLAVASCNGHLEIVQVLLKKKEQILDFTFPIFLAFINNQIDILEELFKETKQMPSSIDMYLYHQKFVLENFPVDSEKAYNSFKILFNVLEEDGQKEFLTAQDEGKTILDCAIKNKNYDVASFLYRRNLDLVWTNDDDDREKIRFSILMNALQNSNDDIEFREFFDLLVTNMELSLEQRHEIERLKSLKTPEEQENIDKSLRKIDKLRKKNLNKAWQLYRENKIEEFRDLVLRSEYYKALCFSSQYVEEGNLDKTFLHRLAEVNSRKSLEFLKCAILSLWIAKNRGEEVDIDVVANIQYNSRNGETRGVTPLYLAIANQNLEAVKILARDSNFNCNITQYNYETKLEKKYSIFEITLDRANSKFLSYSKSYEILQIITGGKSGNGNKASFPKSKTQKEKIAKNFDGYKDSVKNILEVRYPREIKEIKEMAKKYNDKKAIGVEPSSIVSKSVGGVADVIQLRREVVKGRSRSKSVEKSEKRFGQLSLEKTRTEDGAKTRAKGGR